MAAPRLPIGGGRRTAAGAVRAVHEGGRRNSYVYV